MFVLCFPQVKRLANGAVDDEALLAFFDRPSWREETSRYLGLQN